VGIVYLPNVTLLDTLSFLQDADHYQDPAAYSGISQGYSFVGGGDAEPSGALLLQGESTRFGAVSVGVTLDHSTDVHAWAKMLAQHAEVVAQSGERDFSPVGPGGRTDRCQRERQGKMIARFVDEGGGEALPVLATGVDASVREQNAIQWSRRMPEGECDRSCRRSRGEEEVRRKQKFFSAGRRQGCHTTLVP